MTAITAPEHLEGIDRLKWLRDGHLNAGPWEWTTRYNRQLRRQRRIATTQHGQVEYSNGRCFPPREWFLEAQEHYDAAHDGKRCNAMACNDLKPRWQP